MIDQNTFDLSECIGEHLHVQAGLEVALIHALEPVLAERRDLDLTVNALIGAIAGCRRQADAAAVRIIREGAG